MSGNTAPFPPKAMKAKFSTSSEPLDTNTFSGLTPYSPASFSFKFFAVGSEYSRSSSTCSPVMASTTEGAGG